MVIILRYLCQEIYSCIINTAVLKFRLERRRESVIGSNYVMGMSEFVTSVYLLSYDLVKITFK